MGSKVSVKFNQFEVTANEGNASVDLRAGTPIIHYYESVFMPYIVIDFSIIDSGDTLGGKGGGETGLLSQIKLQGSEVVRFSIEDGDGNIIDLTNDNALRVATTDYLYEGFKSTSLSMTAVSKEAYDNTLAGEKGTRCKKNYAGTVSDIVSDILQGNLKTGKTLSIDQTLGQTQFLGNNRKPFDMILDLQRFAIPSVSGTTGNRAGYLFYETVDGYHFKSLDGLFEKQPVKRFIENKQATNILPSRYDGKIYSSVIKKSSHALDQMDSGAYSGSLWTFDEKEGVYKKKDVDNSGKPTAGFSPVTLNKELQGIPTGESFILKPKTRTMPGDPVDLQVAKGNEENFPTEVLIEQTKQTFRTKMGISGEIVIDADFSLHPGDMIECTFPEGNAQRSVPGGTFQSGIYMIAELCHYCDAVQTFTALHIVRDAYGEK